MNKKRLINSLISVVVVLFFGSASLVFAASLNNDPQDFATLRTMNYTVYGDNNSHWSTAVSANSGDTVSFTIYYHNTSSETATDVRVTITPQSTVSGSLHSFNATVSAANAVAVNGNANVSLLSVQTMAFVSGTVLWRPNQMVSGSQTLPFGQNGSELFTSNGLRLGDIAPGWNTQGSIILRFQVTNVQVLAPTVSITANPTFINQGYGSTISWNSSNTASCYATNGWSGVKSLSGSQTVYPSVTTTYTIVCTNSNGQQVSDGVTVGVGPQQPQPQFPTVSINVSQTNLSQGGSVTLNWNSANADSCFAGSTAWFGVKPTSGSEIVSPPNVNSYNLYKITCSNTQGVTSDSVTVYVNTASNVFVTLIASPTHINSSGTPVTLSWSSSNATACYGSNGWSGTKSLSGSETVYPSVISTYTIICTGPNGVQNSSTVTISVDQPNATNSITANPTFINQGYGSTISWNSSNTASCYATNGWSGVKSLSGSQTVYPSVTTTYTIVCTNSNGQQVSDGVTVGVNQIMPTVSISANPTQIGQGGTSVLVWSSSNTVSCYAQGAWSGAKSLSGSQIISPLVTSTYTIICSGSNGTQTQTSVTISVISSIVPPPSVSNFTAACVADSTIVRVGQRVLFASGFFGANEPVIYSWTGAISGTSASINTSFVTAGVKNVTLIITDATGRASSADCSVKVNPAVVVVTHPPATPPAVVVTTTEKTCECTSKEPKVNLTENTKTTTSNGRSVLASLLLAEDGSPRTGVLIILYLFLLAVIALVLYFLYLLILSNPR